MESFVSDMLWLDHVDIAFEEVFPFWVPWSYVGLENTLLSPACALTAVQESWKIFWIDEL